MPFAVNAMLNLSTIDEFDALVPRGAQGDIQSAVSAVEDWSREQCMQLNADKCKDMIIDFKNNKHVFSSVVVDEKELAVIIVPNV